jgi:hypothetical protein
MRRAFCPSFLVSARLFQSSFSPKWKLPGTCQQALVNLYGSVPSLKESAVGQNSRRAGNLEVFFHVPGQEEPDPVPVLVGIALPRAFMDLSTSRFEVRKLVPPHTRPPTFIRSRWTSTCFRILHRLDTFLTLFPLHGQRRFPPSSIYRV